MEQQILDNNLDTGLKEEKQYAGFGIRVGASLIDVLVYLPFVGINLYNLYSLKSLPLEIIITLLLTIYKPFMEYKYGATLGKMAVKVKVVNENLEPITLSQAITRYSPWLLSQIISLISMILLFMNYAYQSASTMAEITVIQNTIVSPVFGYVISIFVLISCIVVAFTDKKQGLHDMFANTYCIYKES